MYRLYFGSLFIIILFLNFISSGMLKVILLFIVIIIALDAFFKVWKTLLSISSELWLVYLVVLLLLISILKTNNYNASISFISFRILLPLVATFFITVMSVYLIHAKNTQAYKLLICALILPLSTVLLINIIMYLFGIHNTAVSLGSGTMFGLVGFDAQRVYFILSGGINSYGVLIGIVLISSIILISFKKNISLFIFFATLAFVSVLLTDTRSVVIIVMLFFMLYFTVGVKKIRSFAYYFAPILSLLGPLVLLWILPLLSGTDFGDLISRSSTDLETGNSRLIIWFSSISNYINFQGVVHLFGYGEFGHFESGVSQAWGYMFSAWGNDGLLTHPHNTYLSILLDTGYVGVVFFLFFQIRAIKVAFEIGKFDLLTSTLAIGILFYVYLLGITETVWGLYYPGMFFPIISTVIITIVYKSYLINTLNKT